jgi:hypothetical protein
MLNDLSDCRFRFAEKEHIQHLVSLLNSRAVIGRVRMVFVDGKREGQKETLSSLREISKFGVEFN